MFKPHTQCRACGTGGVSSTLKQSGAAAASGVYANTGLVPVVDLGVQPLANDWCGDGDERAGYAPLQVLWCQQCSLAQLSVTVKPEILYSKYLYVTSASRMMQKHFEALWADIQKEIEVESVVEIASNDGLFLEFLFKHGVKRAMGIEPAENLVEMSRKRGIQTQHAFFDRKTAVRAGASMAGADLIVARHVFCHIDDWHDFIHNITELTHKNSLICIEVPWVVDMLKGNEFDTIYHEHLSYLSVKSMVALLRGLPLHLHKVIHYPIHGGAIVLMLRRNDCEATLTDTVEQFIEAEDIDLDCWKQFNQRCYDLRQELILFVENAVKEGKTVAGLGASAKSTVWINSCGFTRKHIKFLADSTLGKHWKFCPGTNIPVTDEGAILRELPEYVLVFAWNFFGEVINNNQLAITKGVKFIKPIPKLEVV